jgi:hypothetical protein
MNRLLFILFGLLLLSISSCAQTVKDLTVGLHFDLAKTDHLVFVNKAQLGIEGNYFLSNSFAATGGMDFWTEGKQFSLVAGGRWYPVEEAFVRVRGLIGVNDISIGGGWTKPIDEKWKFEAFGDFYFSLDFAIRAGIVYVIP